MKSRAASCALALAGRRQVRHNRRSGRAFMPAGIKPRDCDLGLTETGGPWGVRLSTWPDQLQMLRPKQFPPKQARNPSIPLHSLKRYNAGLLPQSVPTARILLAFSQNFDLKRQYLPAAQPPTSGARSKVVRDHPPHEHRSRALIGMRVFTVRQ